MPLLLECCAEIILIVYFHHQNACAAILSTARASSVFLLSYIQFLTNQGMQFLRVVFKISLLVRSNPQNFKPLFSFHSHSVGGLQLAGLPWIPIFSGTILVKNHCWVMCWHSRVSSITKTRILIHPFHVDFLFVTQGWLL